jgi:hypothetical protein
VLALSAWQARSAESCSVTSSSSARTIFDAWSPSTYVSTTRHARTKLSHTGSRFHVPRRLRDPSTQSLCSPDSTMTTGALLDARRGGIPSYVLMRDGICSQHGPQPSGGSARAADGKHTSRVPVAIIILIASPFGEHCTRGLPAGARG